MTDKNEKTMDDFLNKKVKAIEVDGPKTLSQLLSEMAQTGFQGKSLARVVDVFEQMIKDEGGYVLHEVAGDTGELGHSELTTGNVPDYVHEVDEHMICVHYNDEEFLYTWRDGDTYEHEAWTMIETYDQDIL